MTPKERSSEGRTNAAAKADFKRRTESEGGPPAVVVIDTFEVSLLYQIGPRGLQKRETSEQWWEAEGTYQERDKMMRGANKLLVILSPIFFLPAQVLQKADPALHRRCFPTGIYCEHCGAAKAKEDGGEIQLCACRRAAYCSKACQKAAYWHHKRAVGMDGAHAGCTAKVSKTK